MKMCNDIPDAMEVDADDVVTVEGPSPSPCASPCPSPSPSPNPKPVDPPDNPIFTTPDADVPPLPPPVELSTPPLEGRIRRPASVLLPVIGQRVRDIHSWADMNVWGDMNRWDE